MFLSGIGAATNGERNDEQRRFNCFHDFQSLSFLQNYLFRQFLFSFILKRLFISTILILFPASKAIYFYNF